MLSSEHQVMLATQNICSWLCRKWVSKYDKQDSFNIPYPADRDKTGKVILSFLLAALPITIRSLSKICVFFRDNNQKRFKLNWILQINHTLYKLCKR